MGAQEAWEQNAGLRFRVEDRTEQVGGYLDRALCEQSLAGADAAVMCFTGLQLVPHCGPLTSCAQHDLALTMR